MSIVFADLVGFTSISEDLTAGSVVEFLDDLVADFDRLVERHGLEKIRTMGDAYMAVAGAPSPRSDHLQVAARMSLDMLEIAHRHTDPAGNRLEVRIGIDSGPVVAGVIGRQKFVYDVWGDSVNTASRMESHGVPGRIHVTPRVHDQLQEGFRFEERGIIDVKGRARCEPSFSWARPAAAEELSLSRRRDLSSPLGRDHRWFACSRTCCRSSSSLEMSRRLRRA